MYDTILVATDGSADANRAATHALEQAEQHDATLHGIFVVDTDRFSEPALSSGEMETIQEEEWGQEQLDEIEARGEDLGVDVTLQNCHGKPYEEIITYADEVDADLLVLGFHGQSHASGDQIGSVTDRVVQNAGRPVLVAA
jgi:nucleotide-binding universal stress UspA family protein